VQRADGETFIQTDVCPQVGDAILNLGCGTRELSAYLAEKMGPKGKVIGVDPDKERIQLARQSHSGIKNLSFVVGSATNFSESGSDLYDIIFCNYVLHWIADKQKAFKNLFESLKIGGEIGIYYVDHLPPFVFNAYKELNPENLECILQKLQLESMTVVEQYCSSAGFEIISSHETLKKEVAFESTDSLLKWLWSGSHGVFDPSLVTEERLSRYLAPHNSGDGKPCLDFRGIKHKYTVCRLIAVKPNKAQ